MTTWKAARIRRRYKEPTFNSDNCGLSASEYYGPAASAATIQWLEERFILSSSSSSTSSSSSSSTSFSSSSKSSSSSSISSISSSSISTSSSSSSISYSSSSSSSSTSSSSSSSSSSESSSSSSLSSSSSSSSESSSSSSLSSSSSSESSSSESSSSTSCFISLNDSFTQSDGTPPNPHRWDEVGNMIVSGGELIGGVDISTNLSQVTTTYAIYDTADFDVQVDWREISVNPSAGWFVGFKAASSDDSFGTRVYKRAHTTTYTEDTVSGGIVIASTNVATAQTSGSFRITRISDIWQSYFWNGGWIAIGVPYFVFSDKRVYISLYVQNNTTTPTVSAAFDNFIVNTATGHNCPESSSSSSSSSSLSSSSSSSSLSSSSSSASSSSFSSSSLSSSSTSSSSSSSSESQSISISTSSP